MSPKSKGTGKATATRKPGPQAKPGAAKKAGKSPAKAKAGKKKPASPTKSAKKKVVPKPAPKKKPTPSPRVKPGAAKPGATKRGEPKKKPLAAKPAPPKKVAAPPAKPAETKPVATPKAASEKPKPEAAKPVAELPGGPLPRPLPPGRSSPLGVPPFDEDEEDQPIRPPKPVRPPLPPSPRAKPLVGPPPPGPKPVARPVLREGAPPEPVWDTRPLPDEKTQLRRWYMTAQMPSPMGGFLESLRVRSEDDGSGTVILECSASSLRYEMHVPAASRGEKSKVKEHQDAGEDPNCPRHEPSQRLNRVGPHLVCPLCGVRYGKVLVS